LKVAFGVDFSTPAKRKAWLSHVTDIMLRYCMAEGAEI
jgi:hypothetical protein